MASTDHKAILGSMRDLIRLATDWALHPLNKQLTLWVAGTAASTRTEAMEGVTVAPQVAPASAPHSSPSLATNFSVPSAVARIRSSFNRAATAVGTTSNSRHNAATMPEEIASIVGPRAATPEETEGTPAAPLATI